LPGDPYHIPRPRVWFKKAMRDAILEGRKTATSRNHRISRRAASSVLAVCGSRFKAVPFAVLRITAVEEMKPSEIFGQHYREEGFNSSEKMVDFADKERLHWDERVPMFFHRFEVIQKLTEEEIHEIMYPWGDGKDLYGRPLATAGSIDNPTSGDDPP